ncbi:MAG TPA: hypothetical protein DC047_09095 [Blastocatellia bacterium]|nr:hypothetical protein [Blastocatellia bacterium]
MNGPTIDTSTVGAGAVLRRGSDFFFGGYTLSCSAGSRIDISPDNNAIQISGAEVLATPGDLYVAKNGSVLILMTGKTGGCLRFAIDLTKGSDPIETDFDRLAIGLRYGQPGPDATVDVLPLPVLRQPANPLTLYGAFDPCNPFEPARTRLSFFADDSTSAAPEMVSNFVTARGHGVHLTPSPSGQRPAGFVFAVQPLMSGNPGTVPTCNYLTLDGEFDFTAVTPPEVKAADLNSIERLVCGASGLEYIGFPDVPGHRVVFLPGRPAFAPLVEKAAPDTPLLNSLGTTAWLYVRPAQGTDINYYSQPDQAPLFQASDNTFLNFLELPTTKFPVPDGSRSFPVAAYLGITPETAGLAKDLEIRALAPERHRVIANLGPGAANLDTNVVGVTPQGLAVGIDQNDPAHWAWLGLAKSQETATLPDVRFTQVTGDFRQAMQANRLFTVLADADTVMASGSVPYCLTPEDVKELRANPQGVPLAILNAVAAQMTGVLKNTEDEFVAGLQLAAPAITNEQKAVFLKLTGEFVATIDSWRFQMSPRNWFNPQRPTRKNALLLLKLTRDRTLKEYAADPGSWTWQEAAKIGGSIETTTSVLRGIIDDAEAAYNAQPGPDNPYSYFVNEILADKNWAGVLCLGAEVPLESLPEALRPLDVGIDATRFFAHHIGFNLTPFDTQGGALLFKRTSMFGLIDYNDSADLLLDANSVEFAFKVLRLSVGFRNSTVSSFSSKIELMVNRMFGAQARLYPTEHGNNLILDGTYQKQLGSDNQLHGAYLFASNADNIFQLTDSALQTVEILSTRLVTNPPGSDADQVSGVFQMSGRLRFWDSQSFDPFSYGPVAPPPEPSPPASSMIPEGVEVEPEEWIETPFGLAMVVPGSTILTGETKESRLQKLEEEELDAQAEKLIVDAPTIPEPPKIDGFLKFDNLGVLMEFDRYVRQPSFTFVLDHLAFDTAHSISRPNSLANRFPVELRSLVAVPNLAPPDQPPAGQDPKDMGYLSVTAHGLQQSLLITPWFGLQYELNLGTLGALASSAGLSMTVLAAWSGGGTDSQPAVYFGIRLPGMKDAVGVELPLQGVIKLGFRSIEFSTYEVADTDPVQLAYLIRFRNFGMHVLGLSFPPGHNDIYLFGNPDQSSTTALGWYAAYARDDDKKKPPKAVNPRLLASRQNPKLPV